MNPSIEQLKKFIYTLLSALPADLYYHSTDHTMDVMDQCMQIGQMEGLSADEIYLLQVAALFHDTGFLHTYDGHERQSCILAEKYLPEFGFDQEKISKITSMIMCTKIPQSPDSKSGEIMCDADLDYLGREDFVVISEKLFRELEGRNRINGRKEWNELQLSFMEHHKYFTGSNILRRSSGKQRNMEIVEMRQEVL